MQEQIVKPFKPSTTVQQIEYGTKGSNNLYNILYCIVNVNIKNKNYGMFYIGVHMCEFLNDDYFGSNSHIKNSIKKYGQHNFYRIDCEFYNTYEEVCLREAEIVNTEFLVNYKKYCYNINIGGGIGWKILHDSPNAKDVYKKIGEKNKKHQNKKWDNISDEEREAYCLRQKESITPEVKKKMSNSQKSRYKNMTEEEEREQLRLKHKETTTPEVKKKMSNSHKKCYEDLTDEEHEEICIRQKEIMNNPEIRDRISNTMKENFNNLTDEEYEKFCLKRKEIRNRPEIKENQSLKMKSYWDNMSDEEYQKVCERRKISNNTLEAKEKRSQKSLNSIWIHNKTTNKTKFIQKENIENFLNDGWELGRK